MDLLDKFSKIKLLVFDMDGVLTNGKLLIHPDGNWLREMDIKDGYALRMAQQMGFTVAVVSGSNSAPVEQRLNYLGINRVYQNVKNKSVVIESLMKDLSVQKEEILFMGDDIPDLLAFHVVGLPTCPSDASSDVLSASVYISPRKGGEGCVRDVIEKVLKSQNKWKMDNLTSST
ncbi:MAG: hypothetical protein RL131_1221 [Bacteroidota bacterium]|jgi:3-deoxy-D-manno-octulosonate 8-phosphate phosphatase (KDO 8-P phosphatase)